MIKLEFCTSLFIIKKEAGKLLIYGIVFVAGMISGNFLNVCLEHFFQKRAVKENHKQYLKKRFDILTLGAVNSILWMLTFVFCGYSADSILSCFIILILLAVSIIDWYIFEIPAKLTLLFAIMGSIRLVFDWTRCYNAIAGGAAALIFLLFFYWITKGKGIGGGDIKLMAAAGLYLGFECCIVAFLFGCVYACIIHTFRMRFFNAGRIFALGPYLAAGIITAIWFGADIVLDYRNLMC